MRTALKANDHMGRFFDGEWELSEIDSLLSHVRVGLKPSPSGEGFSMISFVHAKALQEIES